MKTLIKFTDMPLANNLSNSITDKQPVHDLHIVFDEETKMVQLADNVDAKSLFSDLYVYDSSQSKTIINHFKEAAKLLEKRFYPKSILEIGSNSGIFIKNLTQILVLTNW